MQIFLKTEDEINLMRKANQLVGATLAELGKHIKPGVTTLHLDRVAEESSVITVRFQRSRIFLILMESLFPLVYVLPSMM